MIGSIIFYILAAFITICSIMVVAGRNPVTSAMFLVLDLFFVAALYALLDAHFAAAVQVLVYAGAIVVLFLFVIMLLNIKSDAVRDLKLTLVESAVLGVTIAGFFIIAILISREEPTGLGDGIFTSQAIEAAGGNTYVLAMKMFTSYVWPFELASFLILLAIVASIVIAKKEKQPVLDAAGAAGKEGANAGSR
jgi:NADH-quinone oxidoreductase subunit J